MASNPHRSPSAAAPGTAGVPSGHQGLAAALRGNETLAHLLQRVRDSRLRFDTISPLLPAALAASVKPGPLDDSHWVLLAAHASAAAKLRQMVPELQAALSAAGWAGPAIRVKVSSAP